MKILSGIQKTFPDEYKQKLTIMYIIFMKKEAYNCNDRLGKKINLSISPVQDIEKAARKS
jgi:hypothetical protein